MHGAVKQAKVNARDLIFVGHDKEKVLGFPGFILQTPSCSDSSGEKSGDLFTELFFTRVTFLMYLQDPVIHRMPIFTSIVY